MIRFCNLRSILYIRDHSSILFPSLMHSESRKFTHNGEKYRAEPKAKTDGAEAKRRKGSH